VIKTAIRLRNDTVMVFDTAGEQVLEYQGQYENMKENILRDASPDTVFTHWFGLANEPKSVSREKW